MIVEFVGGPLDGELRDVQEGNFGLVHAPDLKLTSAQAAAIKLRESVYTWAKRDDGKRYLRFEGEV